MAKLRSQSTHPHRSYTNPAPPTCSTSQPTRNRSATFHSNTNDLPWSHMAQTYAWVVENEYMTAEKSNRKTEQWILEQQMFLATENEGKRKNSMRQQRVWEDTVYSYEIIEGERRKRCEEEARKRAVEKERRDRQLMDEVRRIEINMQLRREEQRKRVADERRKAEEVLKERERQSRLRSERVVVEAWHNYEERWKKLLSSSERLSFSAIPWPLVSKPRNAEGITPQGVVAFLFSHLHSEKQTRKERLRSSQLRWHPDRFQRVLDRVRDEDRAEVSKGAGIIARCLNDTKY